MEHIQAMNHTDEEHGLYREKERKWIYRVTELLLGYHSLEDHLCNAGKCDELRFEIEMVMKEHLITKQLDKGLLPYPISKLTIKEFARMKRNTKQHSAL